MFVAADLCLNGATDPPVICVLLLSILACGAVEGDRRQSEETCRQTQELRRGFAGTVGASEKIHAFVMFVKLLVKCKTRAGNLFLKAWRKARP